jgi:hypothetical protein
VLETEEFIRIDEWVPTKKDTKITYDGKLIVVPFDKIFKKQNNDALNNFIIKKESYVKKLEHITHYINYFIKYYDKNNELILAYLKLKFLVDNKDNNIPLGTFIKMVYNILLTDTMIEKINQLVEDNYYIDLTINNDLSKRELEEKIKHNEYERLPEQLKNKIMRKEKTEIKDFIKNPIFINNSHNYKIISERILTREYNFI